MADTAALGRISCLDVDRACSLLADVQSMKTIDAVALREATSKKRVQYLQRLETYNFATWFAKPDLLSPMHCARYGWNNISKDTLQCSLCGATILVKIDDDLDSASVDEISKAYRKQLQHNHDKKCFWFDNPLSEDTMHGPHANNARALMSGRLKELLTISTLSDGSNRFTCTRTGYSLSRALKEHLDATQQHHGTTPPLQLQCAFVLALCGWTIRSHKAEGVCIYCVCCQMQELFPKDSPVSIELNESAIGHDVAMHDNVLLSVRSNEVMINSSSMGTTKKRDHDSSKVEDGDDQESGCSPNNGTKRVKMASSEVFDSSDSQISESSCHTFTPSDSQISKSSCHTFNPIERHRFHCPFALVDGTLYDLTPMARSSAKQKASSTSIPGHDTSRSIMVGAALAMLAESTSPIRNK